MYKWKLYTKKVHRLVATAFIPNPDNLPEVDHIDRNRYNNSVENLRWLPHKNNIPINPTEKRVRCIETNTIYDSTRQASRETGVNQGSISRCCRGLLKTAGGFHWEYVD